MTVISNVYECHIMQEYRKYIMTEISNVYECHIMQEYRIYRKDLLVIYGFRRGYNVAWRLLGLYPVSLFYGR